MQNVLDADPPFVTGDAASNGYDEFFPTIRPVLVCPTKEKILIEIKQLTWISKSVSNRRPATSERLIA
jgi:hypothetical protein